MDDTQKWSNQGASFTRQLKNMLFVDGRAYKKEYRKYKTRTAAKHDDYGAMREVVRRRYTRVLKENLPLPDLIIIDGGKGQIEAAREVIEDELGLDILG